jgi:flagellar biosynthesis protein FliP
MSYIIRTTLLALVALAVLLGSASVAQAQVAPVNPDPVAPVSEPIVEPASQGDEIGPQTPAGGQGPQGPNGGGEGAGNASISLDIGDALNQPSQSIVVILLITLLSVSPAFLVMLTSFTRIVIVLGLTRNALGVTGIPPNQVVVGLALFISLFIMAPTFNDINENAVQPYLAGEMNQEEAFSEATGPMREFMLKQTRTEELQLFIGASQEEPPDNVEDVSLTTLIPAFILSELKTAFIIGFVIFVPFLVIDVIIAAVLMSMGMMMLPPQMISLPFKLLLFVLVDGWALVVESLITSFN